MEHTPHNASLRQIKQVIQKLLQGPLTDEELDGLEKAILDVDLTLSRLKMENQVLQARYDELEAVANPSGAPFVGLPRFAPAFFATPPDCDCSPPPRYADMSDSE